MARSTAVCSDSRCCTPRDTTTPASTPLSTTLPTSTSAAGDNDGAAVALILATVDRPHPRRPRHVARGRTRCRRRCRHAGDVPVLRFLGGIVEAATASLEGDPARPSVRPSRRSSLAACRRRSTNSCSASTPTCCACAAGPTRRCRSPPDCSTSHERVRPHAARRRSAGWPATRRLSRRPRSTPDVPPGTNDRYRLYHASYGMAVAASFGDRDTVAAVRPVLESASALDVRDRMLFAVAVALGHVADHDEARRRRRHPLDMSTPPLGDRVADGRLRRLLAVAYVCDERVRRALARRRSRAVAGAPARRRRGPARGSGRDAGQTITGCPTRRRS